MEICRQKFFKKSNIANIIVKTLTPKLSFHRLKLEIYLSLKNPVSNYLRPFIGEKTRH